MTIEVDNVTPNAWADHHRTRYPAERRARATQTLMGPVTGIGTDTWKYHPE